MLFLIFQIPDGYGVLNFEDHAFPEFITSARSLAMGNAYLNRSDDSWAAFYNPAGLGSVRKPTFHLLNAHLEVSAGLLKAVTGGPFFDIPKRFMSVLEKEEMRDVLEGFKGDILHSRVNLFPNLTFRGMTLGYLFSKRSRALINDDSFEEFEILQREDSGPVLSISYPFFGRILKLGVTAIYLNRTDLYKVFDITESVNFDDNDYQKGQGIQVTAGARLTIPVELLPTFSVVLRNATDNSFNRAEGSVMNAAKIKQTMDVGLSLTPNIARLMRLHLEVNYKDVHNAYETDERRRLTAGFEVDIRRKIYLRGGWGDGFGSAGLGVKANRYSFDLTTYAVDRAYSGFRVLEDRRWALSFAFGY